MSGPDLPRPRLCVVSEPFGPTQAISFGPALDGAFAVRLVEARDLPDPTGPSDLWEPDLGQPDAVILSRVVSAAGERAAAAARAGGVPVIFHLDDDLLDVPEALGDKAARYRDPALVRQLRANIEACDLVYASTLPLAERLRAHGLDVPIVAGDLYCSIDPEALRPAWPSELPVIGYMGSSGHARDLDLALPAIEALLDRIPDLGFELFGTIARPARLDRFGARVRHLPVMRDYAGFLARLRALGWWAGLAPLEDHPFNRCKADTKWVEYSLAGIAVVATDLPVYHRACDGGAGFLAATPQDWEGHLGRLLADRRLREATVAAARRKLAAEYGHARLARQVLGLLEAARRQEPGAGAPQEVAEPDLAPAEPTTPEAMA